MTTMYILHWIFWIVGFVVGAYATLIVLMLLLEFGGEKRAKVRIRQASYMQSGFPGECDELTGSWFGSVRVALPEEEWPTYKGVPMLPLCQLRCDEIPARPAALDGSALICVFVAYAGEETVSPHGERWILRTYPSLDGLVPISYPEDLIGICSYPIRWLPIDDSPDDRSQIPNPSWLDFILPCRGAHHDDKGKVGGYGWNSRGKKPSLEGLQADFAFQFRIEGDFPCLRGSGGKLSFARSRMSNRELWFITCDPPPFDGTLGTPVRLGCEVEGVQIYTTTWDRLRIYYQGRFGSVAHLNDLHGLVHITTPEMALRFVRLRTCNFLSQWGNIEHEVCLENEDSILPDWFYVKLPDGSKISTHGSWTLAPCEHLGSEAAQVEIVEGGFRIVRWICIHNRYGTLYPTYIMGDWCGNKLPQASYQKFVETVSVDGAYTCTVLEESPPSPFREQQPV